MLGVVNFLVRPVVRLLTLPITIVTLGLWLIVVNAFMLLLTSWLVSGFAVDGFLAALGGAVVIGLVNWVLSGIMRREARRAARSVAEGATQKRDQAIRGRPVVVHVRVVAGDVDAGAAARLHDRPHQAHHLIGGQPAGLQVRRGREVVGGQDVDVEVHPDRRLQAGQHLGSHGIGSARR